MTSTLLIAMMIVLYACQTLFCRLYNQRYPGEESTSPFVYNVIYGVFVSIVTFAVGKGRFAPSTATVLLGLLNGAVLFGYNLSLIKATASGSYAVANLCLLAGGILIPLFQSVIVYHVPLNALQYAGVAVMLAAFLFLNLDGIVGGRKEKKAKTAASRLFPLFCTLLFLFNGLYGALLNAQQEAMGNTQREEMIIVTFLFTALLGFVMLLSKRGRSSLAAFRQTKSSALCHAFVLRFRRRGAEPSDVRDAAGQRARAVHGGKWRCAGAVSHVRRVPLQGKDHPVQGRRPPSRPVLSGHAERAGVKQSIKSGLLRNPSSAADHFFVIKFSFGHFLGKGNFTVVVFTFIRYN